MDKQAMLDRFEDMASESMDAISEHGQEVKIYYITELLTLLWAVKELAGLTYDDLEPIVQDRIGMTVDDLMEFEVQRLEDLELGR